MHEADLGAVAQFVLQLGVVLIAAKLGAEAAERLRQPPVLGELLAGVAIGPFALGGLNLPLVGAPLFDGVGRGAAVSAELYSVAQIGAVLLLFSIGLETDLMRFIRYSQVAALVAVGGNLVSFFGGAGLAVALGIASSPSDPAALFLGAIIATTSVGVGARVLADLHQLDTPEGVTILGGAVIDDILGIVILGLAVGSVAGEGISAQNATLNGVKALGALAVLFSLGVVATRQLSRLPLRLRTDGATIGLALGTAFVAAFLIERAGLALILGSYAVGLALARCGAGATLESGLRPLRQTLVPVFFVVTGALVNLSETMASLGLGVALCAVAILGKGVGCGVPALALGFRGRRLLRIVAGMLPRGEVALIVAGTGLSSGAITSDVFGVAILVVLVTTLLGSPLLALGFGPEKMGAAPVFMAEQSGWTLGVRATVADVFMRSLERTLAEKGFAEIVRFQDAEGWEILEFGRTEEGRFLSVALEPGEVDPRQIRVEVTSREWRAPVIEAIDEAAADMTIELLEPLIAADPEAGARIWRSVMERLGGAVKR